MRQYRPLPALLAFVTIGILGGCREQPTGPAAPLLPGRPASAILDGAHGGNTRFFFLPPMVRAPTYSGAFDASQSPVVQICELSGTTCGASIATFSGSAVKLEEEAYRATWKTKDAGLDPAMTYRIQVLIGTSVLGYADVVVLSNGSQIKTIDKSQFVPTINGGVLNIRFRIEQAAPPPPPSCTPGALGCGWQDGDVITYSQDVWGDPTVVAGQLLFSHFDALYFADAGVLQIGGPITMTFTNAEAIHHYMPSVGTPGALNANLVDPLSSSSGQFGGEIVALKLNIDFSAAGHTLGAASVRFGNLTLCKLESPLSALNGTSVADVLALANTALGGGATTISMADLNLLAIQLNGSFEAGAVSQFAQDHLFNGACDGSGWKHGEVTTYSQLSWGEPSMEGGAQIVANYDAVYAGTLGQIEVGVPGSSGFAIIFSSSGAVLAYLPSTGPAAALNADLVDPLSSASGIFGGEVLGLRLNIDFSDAGHIPGSSAVRFGDLTLCGFPGSLAGLNGSSVRALSLIVNTALGGGSTPYALTDLNLTTFDLNNSFHDGVPSAFAQQHLVDGACPP